MNPLITDVLQQNQYFTIGFVVLASVFFIIKYISLASDATNNFSLRRLNKLKAINLDQVPNSSLTTFITKAYDEEVFNVLTQLNANRKTMHILVRLYEKDILTIKQLKLVGRFLKEKDDKLLIEYQPFDKFQAAYSQMLFVLSVLLFLYLFLNTLSMGWIAAVISIPIYGFSLYVLGEFVIQDFNRFKALEEIYPELEAENIIHPESDNIEVKFINLMSKKISFKKKPENTNVEIK